MANPIRVAFIVHAFPASTETFILRQIVGLLQRGVVVEIHSRGPADKQDLHHDVERHHLLRQTVYWPTAPANLVWRLLKGIALFLWGVIRAPGAVFNAINPWRHGREAVSLRLLYAVVGYLRGHGDYDLVHCHFGPNGLLAARLKALGVIKAPIVTTFHGYDITEIFQHVPNHYYRELFEWGDLFTVSSHFIGRKLAGHGCPDEKIIRIPVGVRIDRYPFRLRGGNGHGEHGTGILFVGRLVDKKGVHFAIRAMDRVRCAHPNTMLRIIGDGPMRQELEALTNLLHLSDNVAFLGVQGEERVIELYDQADLLVLPSFHCNGWEEGQGLVLLEAQACGMPVVGSNFGGIPESLIDGETGYLAPQQDSDALAECFIRLIDNRAEWPRLGAAGRAHVEKTFNLDRANDALVEQYLLLLKRPADSSEHPIL